MLQAQSPHLLRSRAEKNEPGALACLRKIRVLTQKAIAGMNSFSTGIACGLQNSFGIEIAFHGWRRTKQHSKIGLRDMRRMAVRLGIHGDWRHAQLSQCADDAARNNTSI